jgi:hypothetical protein
LDLVLVVSKPTSVASNPSAALVTGIYPLAAAKA